LFTDGGFAKVATPSGGGTAPSLVTVPTLSVASGAVSNSITASITQATAGKYDQGQLIVSHDGDIVATAPLDSLLAAGGTLTLSDVPGGNSSSAFGSALYYISTRTWNSSDPTGTVVRQSYPTPVDLRSGSVTGYTVTID
jgi:hypothetical protein